MNGKSEHERSIKKKEKKKGRATTLNDHLKTLYRKFFVKQSLLAELFSLPVSHSIRRQTNECYGKATRDHCTCVF